MKLKLEVRAARDKMAIRLVCFLLLLSVRPPWFLTNEAGFIIIIISQCLGIEILKHPSNSNPGDSVYLIFLTTPQKERQNLALAIQNEAPHFLLGPPWGGGLRLAKAHMWT